MARGVNKARGAISKRAQRQLPQYALEVNVPQHALDYALAQAVSASFTKQMRAAYAGGRTENARVCAQIRRLANDCLRWLSKNPWAVITPRQRAGLARCLSPETLTKVMAGAKLHAGVGADMPECLRPENLPKKPPARKASE